MSAVFDALQQLVQDFVPKGDVQNEARALIGALHSHAHKNNDDANRDPAARVAAGRLVRAMESVLTPTASDVVERLMER